MYPGFRAGDLALVAQLVERLICNQQAPGSSPGGSLSFTGNIKKDTGINMIKITHDEADYLRSKKLGYLVHVSSATHKGRAKRYYLTEDRKALYKLKEYRENSTTYVYK